jgi:hypothetical protein
MDHHAMGEGWDPSFEHSPCGGEVMDSGQNGPEAIPMAMKVRPSSFALADDGIQDQELGAMTPSLRCRTTIRCKLEVRYARTRCCEFETIYKD